MRIRMWDYIRRIVCLSLLLALFPFCLSAEKNSRPIPDKPQVDSLILQKIFQFSPFYARIVDEYKADLYLKGRIKVHKSNRLIRYVPSMFRLEKGINDYILESFSEMHYVAPDVYNRKIKAISTTFPRTKGQIVDLTDFLNMNIYSSSIMTDKLLSPLDQKSSRYYHYLLDTVADVRGCRQYKILIIPKFEGTQLVNGYIWVDGVDWTIRETYMEGKYDVITFKLHTLMGEEGDEMFLPVRLNLNVDFKFMGNHLEMDAGAWVGYKSVSFNIDGKRRKSTKKHSHDLTEFYRLTCDTTQLITDKEKFRSFRPFPLTEEEDSLYQDWAIRKTNKTKQKAVKKEKKSAEFWGQVGDVLISSYDVNISGIGSVRCSPLINPVMLSYSHSKGISYKQKFKYNRLFSNGKLLKITPQIGYNFTHKELYLKGDVSFLYWPEKQGSFDVDAGNGNRIYSSVVLDKLKSIPDSTFKFANMNLDYFKDIYLNVFHTLEPVNGLQIKAGVSVHWRYLMDNNRNELMSIIDKYERMQIRSEYNSFAPRIRIEWTPGMYYYMNGRRKMNVKSKMPTFILDYERGLKGVFGSTDAHERWEFDVQQKIKLNQIRTLAYRVGGGLFTRMDNVYFVDFVNFRRSNIPEDWNDEIGGTFQLLDGRWYNSSSQYWRGNLTYESPFILLRPLNRWLGMIQHERLYGGILFMPHLNPYIELGYGIGTHVFDAGVFISGISGKYDTFGFKFTFELFND
ncbi:MAG: hypothetical protein IJY59_00510 [Bacteroidaceae bacterium]|nr:hypothetical protein [Bacteroidaceae bacterium]